MLFSSGCWNAARNGDRMGTDLKKGIQSAESPCCGTESQDPDLAGTRQMQEAMVQCCKAGVHWPLDQV